MTPGKKITAQPMCYLLLLVAALLTTGCSENRFQALEAKAFTLPTLTGDGQISLHDYPGDVVYVTFWASWCVPCRQEMPHLASLWRKNKERGFQVIGINVDEDVEAARQFAAEHDLPFPLARDADRTVSKLYRVPGYPTHFVVDRRGRIRYSAVGFNEDDALAVSQEVEVLLREPVDAAD